MLRYKTETRPGLVALYDIRPGNEAGQFLQPRSPHGAQVCKRKCSTLKELIPFNSDQNTLTNRKWVVNNCGQPALSTSSSDWRTCAMTTPDMFLCFFLNKSIRHCLCVAEKVPKRLAVPGVTAISGEGWASSQAAELRTTDRQRHPTVHQFSNVPCVTGILDDHSTPIHPCTSFTLLAACTQVRTRNEARRKSNWMCTLLCLTKFNRSDSLGKCECGNSLADIERGW